MINRAINYQEEEKQIKENLKGIDSTTAAKENLSYAKVVKNLGIKNSRRIKNPD